jgi:hypothetical protein
MEKESDEEATKGKERVDEIVIDRTDSDDTQKQMKLLEIQKARIQ